MTSPNPDNLCPVCGFDLGFPPWNGLSASDEICPSCGIQFGYEDMAGGDLALRHKIYDQWRDRWVRGGMKWQSQGQPEPSDWDPAMQLIRAGLSSRPACLVDVSTAETTHDMSSSLTQVIALLDAIARVNERFVALEHRFWARREIARVNRALDVRRWDYGLVIETYVDIATVDGNTMAWLMEIVWDASHWTVQSRVTTNRGEHEEVLTRFPDRKATSIEELIAELDGATDTLIGSAESPTWVGET